MFMLTIKTRARRTTGAKGSNSFARNNKFWITDDHIKRIRLQVSANNKEHIAGNRKHVTGGK